MSTILIENRPKFTKEHPTTDFLRVSEFFANTIQGEGINIGMSASFLRLQGCTLRCSFCDTIHIWNRGNPYSINELLNLIEFNGLIKSYKQGQHLVITGGSPLLQQEKVIIFIEAFIDRFGFKPYLEIENECQIMPDGRLLSYIDCWNNSPKLQSSGNIQYNYKIISLLTKFNSWWKFVITEPDDWHEINRLYIMTGIIPRNRIILMPEGQTKKELDLRKEMVLKLSIENNVRFSTRQHIDFWDVTTGV